MDKLTFIATIIAELSIVIPVVVAFAVVIVKIINGMKCQLRSDMLVIYYHNREARTIRQYEYENFVKCYEAYKALKGNSFIDKIYKEVQSWEVIS